MLCVSVFVLNLMVTSTMHVFYINNMFRVRMVPQLNGSQN